MSVAVASVEKINALKTGIEATTGESYNDLTEAVQSLKNGYGQSGSGEVGKPYIDTSKMANFSNFFKNNPALFEDIDDLDTSNGTDFSSMFSGCSSLTTIPQLDTSKGTNFSYMFNSCSSLTTIPPLDTSMGTNFSYMFQSCSSLTTIPQLDTSMGTNFLSMFKYCYKLTTIPQLDTSKGTNFSYMFQSCRELTEVLNLNVSEATDVSAMFEGCQKITTINFVGTANKLGSNKTLEFIGCSALTNLTIPQGVKNSVYAHQSNNLTQESLHGMIENLADLTGQTAKTFKVGGTNLTKIDEEHLAMLEAKNWAYS